MQEIEMKFKIDNIDNMKEKLIEKGCVFSDRLHQKDTVFVSDINNVENGEGTIWIRIRSINNKIIELNLKKQSARLSQSKEIEFEVSNYNNVYEFLNILGLQEWVCVEKTRITTKYKEFNICIDSVKGLGNFVEIEILTDNENKIEFYENKIINIAKELDIETKNRVHKHYDTMINEKK